MKALISTVRNPIVPLPSPGDQEIDVIYAAFRRGHIKLIGADGEARSLPSSLYSFLLELSAQITENKFVVITGSQATLTTMEAANTLGVSRQFLVNLLEKGEIPCHMVGTHRRLYAQDLFRYKAARDAGRHKILRDLAVAEAAEGLYERIPVPPAALFQ